MQQSDFDPELAANLVGKTVLVGLSYRRGDAQAPSRVLQRHGRIVHVSREMGIVVESPDGMPFALPPDLSRLTPAAAGDYRLQATGEVVQNPDYLCSYEIQEREDAGA